MVIHSYFSLKYGVYSPEDIVRWASKAGYAYVFLADINSTGATLAFVRAAQSAGIQPVVGVVLKNGMQTLATIMARNNRGVHEMNVFLTQHLKGQAPPNNNLPHFSNCFVFYPLDAVLSRPLFEHEYYQMGIADFGRWEYQYKRYIPEAKVALLEPMIFNTKKAFNIHRILRAIHHNVLLSKLSVSEQASDKARLLDKVKFEEVCAPYLGFWTHTQQLFERCAVTFDFGSSAKPQNPVSYTSSKYEDEQLLRQLCAEGIPYRYATLNDDIVERIEKEIDLIAQKDYLSYFLIAWDFTAYARSKMFFYVGRGSGANSIVAYLLRITDVDPLALDLYFERFINLYRKNPPDFDLDFSWKDRDEVVRYIFEKYPHSAWLCTYNTFQYRSTVRELGKVFGLPKTEIDQLIRSKKPSDHLGAVVMQYASYIQGIPSHLSVHSGGIVISEKPITWFSATFLPPKGFATTQFSMMEAEDVGLYKFDVLSQRGLAKIRETLDIIAYNQPDASVVDIHNMNELKEDPKIKTLLSEARALGCFYVESPAMRMLLVKLQVKTYLELVAASSIIRPGVSQSGMMREYILRHRNPELRKQANPILLDIMPETYGVMVYQEDVIKVAHYFAGLSLAEADVLRRGMSGKFRSRGEFTKVQNSFFLNCKRSGHDDTLSLSVWNQIESFAGYAFSKGHSASYAVESYQSLYLKAHFPIEYMVATINNFGGYYRTEIYVHEARKLGAHIEPPCVQYGSHDSILYEKRLILGFSLVEGLEDKTVLSIFKNRQNGGSFLDFSDFLKRVSMPLDQCSILIRVGALRFTGLSRKEMLWKAHALFFSAKYEKNNASFSSPLFEEPMQNYDLPSLEEHPMELIFDQLDLLGFPLCNPFELLSESVPPHTLAEAIPRSKAQRVEMYGYLVSVKRSTTNRGELMCFGTFLDFNGDTLDTVHFPESVKKYPFQGKGIYHMKGIITEEWGYYGLEVGYMRKMRWMDDVRYKDVDDEDGQQNDFQLV